jgi:hypothetical protein
MIGAPSFPHILLLVLFGQTDRDHSLRGGRVGRNGSDLTANEISRQRRKPMVLTIRPPIFDHDVAAASEPHGSGHLHFW